MTMKILLPACYWVNKVNKVQLPVSKLQDNPQENSRKGCEKVCASTTKHMKSALRDCTKAGESQSVKLRIVMTGSTTPVSTADNWEHCSATRSADLMIGVKLNWSNKRDIGHTAKVVNLQLSVTGSALITILKCQANQCEL